MEPEPDESLNELVSRLERARPVPAPAFRGDLGRHMLSGAGTTGTAAQSSWVRIKLAALTASGGACLAIAAAGLAGAGPFAS